MADNISLFSGDLQKDYGEVVGGNIHNFYFPPYTHIIVGSYIVLIGILGTFGNCVVLTMFVRFRALVSPTTILLINLAISDLGLIIFGFPFSASSSFSKRWLFGNSGCQFYAFMGFLFGSAHKGNLALLALDRYLVTCKFDLRGKLSYRRYLQMLCAVWAYALFWAAMPLLGWGRYGLEPHITTCLIDWQHNDMSYKTFIFAFFLFGFLIPMVIIALCYSAIVKHMRRQRLSGGTTENPFYDQWANETSVTAMSLILIVAFMVAWAPYAILCLWTVFDEPATVPPVLTLIPPLFAKTSTVFNPVIYFLTNPRLRAGILATVLCACRDPPPDILVLQDMSSRGAAKSAEAV